jgi:ABC-type transport system involved in multi-copper enzyme maturation permease subunit
LTNAPRGPRFGLGPVFAYEWAVSSRRWQGYALRSSFAGMLLAALFATWATRDDPGGTLNFRTLAALGQSFYFAVVGTQLTLVLLAAPAVTAGAICLDRATGALAHVLMTDLSDTEIVLGKLAARLVPVLGLVACALPILAILTLLGGVDPGALLGSFLLSVGLAVFGCSLALLLSLWSRKTHEALLGTYAVWGLWLVGRPFVRHLNVSFGWSLDFPQWLADPYVLAFSPYWYPGTVSLGDYVGFLAVTSALAAGLTALAVFRLRAVCTREVVPRPKRARARLGPRLNLPGPSLDANPVLWREWHRSRPSGWARVVQALFVAGAVTASVGAVVAPRSTFSMAWVNGLQVSIGMLMLSVTAATSLAEERVRGSLDVLLATPMSTREIVLGKWLGTFRVVPWLAVLPVLVVLCGDASKPIYLPTAVLTLAFVLACGAAVTSLGLAMATWCDRLGRAVALTVTIYLLVTVGVLFLGVLLLRGPRDEGLLMASPFFFAGGLAAGLCAPGGGHHDHIEAAFFWLTVYAGAALMLLSATLATFNRCLGRVEEGDTRVRRPVRRAAGIVKSID